MILRDQDLATRALPVEQQPDRTDVPKTHPKGRRCKEDGCITILHQYNPGPWCECHTDRHRIRMILGDIEPVEEAPLFVPLYRAPVTL